MGQHTPEPWSVSAEEYDAESGVISIPEIGRLLHETNADWSPAEDWGIDKANAERIVACVNACAGIANPEAISEMLCEVKVLLMDLEFIRANGMSQMAWNAATANALNIADTIKLMEGKS